MSLLYRYKKPVLTGAAKESLFVFARQQISPDIKGINTEYCFYVETKETLSPKELELLRYLIDHRGQVVSREELLEGVWAYQPGVSSRTIDVHVAWLRQKLEDNPANPRHIHTVRGVGYRFEAGQ